MTSPDGCTRSALQLLAANARLGWFDFRMSWPLPVYLLGELLPGVIRLTVYALIGYLAAGLAGMKFAYVGCVVLAVMAPCISHVSDIPVYDADLHTYAAVRRGSLPPLLQYVARALPTMGLALVDAVATWLVIGLVTRDTQLLAHVASCLPMLLVTVPFGVLFGLAAVAPAIGNDYQNLTHNAAVALVTICSGAIFPTTVNPVLDAIAQVMPLHHTVSAFRAAVDGGNWWMELGDEVLVGLSWALVAAAVYAVFDARGRRSGTGAFAA